jgi:undecaprenyl-diphosphatase
MAGVFVLLIILGIVQGIAEFIPISSSGHLVILEQIDLFHGAIRRLGAHEIMYVNVALHLATLIALVIFLRRDIRALFVGFFRGIAERNFRGPEMRAILSILIASIPAAAIGLLFHDQIEEIFSSAFSVFILLIINGIILIFTKKIPVNSRKIDQIGLIRSIWIGCFQAFAILPGISRSGMTITGGMATGLMPVESARFSFLMSIPVIIGAGLIEGIRASHAGFPRELLPALGVSMSVAALVGLISLKVLFALVKNVRIHIFGYYTVAVGLAGLAITLMIR